MPDTELGLYIEGEPERSGEYITIILRFSILQMFLVSVQR